MGLTTQSCSEANFGQEEWVAMKRILGALTGTVHFDCPSLQSSLHIDLSMLYGILGRKSGNFGQEE